MDEVIEVHNKEENNDDLADDLVHLWAVEGTRVLALTTCILTSGHSEIAFLKFTQKENLIDKLPVRDRIWFFCPIVRHLVIFPFHHL